METSSAATDSSHTSNSGFTASARAITSTGPPGPNGTSSLMGRSGQAASAVLKRPMSGIATTAASAGGPAAGSVSSFQMGSYPWVLDTSNYLWTINQNQWTKSGAQFTAFESYYDTFLEAIADATLTNCSFLSGGRRVGS